jgi:hypothetical protein
LINVEQKALAGWRDACESLLLQTLDLQDVSGVGEADLVEADVVADAQSERALEDDQGVGVECQQVDYSGGPEVALLSRSLDDCTNGVRVCQL